MRFLLLLFFLPLSLAFTSPRFVTKRPLTQYIFPKSVESKEEHDTSVAPLQRIFKNPEETALEEDVETTEEIFFDPQTVVPVILVTLATVSIVGINALGVDLKDIIDFGTRLVAHPQDTLQDVIEFVQDLGPIGAFYFGIMYLIAEILAVPATPLTLSAGYLFGLAQGTAVVLVAATLAASFAFVVGKTSLRGWVESVLEENPEFAKIDKAIGKEGFKLLLLVRLSPIFPFALSNYLYGASSIDFASYFWGTLLGFTPGTIGYVYTGMVGQQLTLGGQDSQPWYVYAGGFAILITFLKLVTDVATNLIETLQDEE